mmetsp:Transcript_55314/g.135460  ORF Transcript_55314/g.135460 Transcript_55314/m.135460 type:complete len:85 (+) Transcript_55314:295-549(+)
MENRLGAEGIEALEESLQHLTTLQALNLSETLQHLPALWALNLSWNDLGAEGGRRRCSARLTALRMLSLSYNELGAARFEALGP